MRFDFKKVLLFLLIFVSILIGSLSAVSYLSSNGVFDAEISYINNVQFPYSVSLNLNKKIDQNLDFDLEIIYKKKNLVVGSKSFTCLKKNCEITLPIKQIFFDDYEIVITTSLDGKFYQKKVPFKLINNLKKFNFDFKKAYYFNLNDSINIYGSMKTNFGNSDLFFIDISPIDFPKHKESFNISCKNTCDFSFNLKKNVIYGKYNVKIYSESNTLEKSFNIFLNSSNIFKPGLMDEVESNNILEKELEFVENSNFTESYDKSTGESLIILKNYSNVGPIEILMEDVLGNVYSKNISFFSGNFKVMSGIKTIKIKGNSSKNLKLDLVPKLNDYSNIEDFKLDDDLKKQALILSGKFINSESVEFGSKNYTSVSSFYNSQKLNREMIPGIGKVVRILSDGTISINYFAYGLVSINTKKPLYKQYSKVDLYAVVLDSKGNLYPNANLTIDVTNSNITYVYTRKEIVETAKLGLYHLSFPTNNLGKYLVKANVMVNGMRLSISTYFNIVSNYSFDIVRRVPFTIDPWQGPFENSFEIKSLAGFANYNFYEEIPKNFVINATNAMKIILTNNSQILVWKKINDGFKPWYRAQAPLKSPDLYELGKSWIEYKQKGKTKKFYENRSWIFAIDPATTFEYGAITKQKKTFYLTGANGLYNNCNYGNPPIPSHSPATMNTTFPLPSGWDYTEDAGRGNGCVAGVTYNLTYNFSKNFIIDGDVHALIYLQPADKYNGGNIKYKAGKKVNVQADLLDSINGVLGSVTRNQITTSSAVYNPQEELFTITPFSNIITAGSSMTFKLTNIRKRLVVSYGPLYPSRLEIYTKTAVSVDDIILRNATNNTVVYKTGDILNVFANVSDALIMSDVNSTNITILYPNGSIRINDVNMSLNISNSSWNYYNYSTTILAADPVGTYTVEITAHEGPVTHTSRAFFSKLAPAGNAVSVVPSRTKNVNQGQMVDIVHYIFNLDPNNAHSYNLFTNSSYVTTLFQDNGINALVDNDGDGIVDTGLIQPGQFKKIVARVTIPASAFINSKLPVVITAKPASTNYYGSQNFESFLVGNDATNWFDTRADYSMLEDNTLFKVKSLFLNKVLGTTSTKNNIHTHYNGTGALNFKDYEITGKFYYTDSNSSLGITFLSNYPNSNVYYSLMADKTNTSIIGDGTMNQFHIFSNNGGTLVGDFNSNQNAINNSWYKFRIRLNDTGTVTNIKAKLWKASASEYPFWQIDTNATGPSRLTQGTFGFWTKGVGSKYFDDLRVANISIDDTVTDSVTDYIQVLSNIKAQKQLYPHMGLGGITSLNSTPGILPTPFCVAGKKLSDCSKNGPPPVVPALQYLGVVSFNKTPGFYQDFYLNGSITIPILLLPEAGKAGGKDTITLKLYSGNTLIGSDSHVDVGNGAGITPFLETFNINPIVDYIPAGENLSLQFSTRKYTYFYFDNSSLKSYINFPSLTFISVSNIDVKNISGVSKDIFNINESMVFKINVTDPIGVSAIAGINMSIKYPNGSLAYNQIIPTFEINGSFWKTYNFTFANTTVPGTYTIDVNVREDNNVTSVGSTTRTVLSNFPAISITPDNLGTSKVGVSKLYAHTITNANGVDYDIVELNKTSTFSTVNFYLSDGVTALTDTDADGLVDTGYLAPGASLNIIANVFIPAGTPIDSVDVLNITAISATTATANSTAIDTTTVVASNPENKQLYFHQNLALIDLSNVTPPTNISLAKFICLDGGSGACPNPLISSVSFPMQTNFSRDFKFTSNIDVNLWVAPELWGVGGVYPPPLGACNGGTKDNVRVEIHTISGLLIGSSSKVVLGSNQDCLPQLVTFSINPLITTVLANEGLNITVSSTRNDLEFYYDNSTYESMIDMQTSTFINTKSVDVFNSTNGIQNNYFYNESYNITFRANITDPFGAYDIKSVNITLTAPNGSILNSTNMTLQSNATSWKYFNFSREFLADNGIGSYTVLVLALESNGVVSNATNTFLFLSHGPEVQITPNNIVSAAANTTITLLHTITNVNGGASDVADITYNITPSGINVSFTDIAGTALIDTDFDGIVDSGTLAAAGGSKIIKAVLDLPSNLNPSDVVVLNIIVNSSLNISRSDFANDTINIVNNVPKLKTLYLHMPLGGIPPALMNTSPQALIAPTNCFNLDPQNVNGGGSGACGNTILFPVSFNQSPAFFKTFDFDGNFLVKAYIDSPAGADVQVILKTSSGTLIGTDTKNRLTTSGIQQVLFSITPSIGVIPNNESLILTFNELGRGDYDLYMDKLNPSRLEMNTFTYISVDSLKVLNSTNGIQSLFATNSTVNLKINVSDPFTVTDIINLTLGLTYPNGTIYLNFTNLSSYVNGSNWKAYNFTINGTNTTVKGIHSIEVRALELNGVIDSAKTTFTIDYLPPMISNILASPGYLTINDTTTLSATIIDDLQIANASIYITHFNGTQIIKQMNNTFGNTYSYDYNLTTQKGTYTYFISAVDTSGNSINSSVFSFKVVGPRVTIGIEQIGASFKTGQSMPLKVPISYISADKELLNIGLNVSAISVDFNTSSKIYLDTAGIVYNKLSDIGAIISIDAYNSSLSVTNTSVIPDLEVSFFNGVSYVDSRNCELNLEYGSVGAHSFNCSIYITDKNLIANWAANPLNRKISVRGINLDNNGSSFDSINYSNAYIIWDTPSNILNYGYSPLDFNVSIKFIDNSTGLMTALSDLYNQNTFILAGENLDLSAIWNSKIIPDGLNLGQHYIYTALVNKISGSVLVDDFSNVIEDMNSFVMDYLKINVISPIGNISLSNSADLWLNVSLESNSFPSGGWCGYSLDGASNVTLNNLNLTYYYNNLSTLSLGLGNHNIVYYCNDSTNYISKIETNFSVLDDVGPVINFNYPENNSAMNPLNSFGFKVSDFTGVENCSLYVDSILKNFSSNITRDVSLNMTTSGVYTEGIHQFNMSCYDNSTAKNLGYSDTLNFIIDTINPNINFTAPTAVNNSFVNHNWAFVNVSVNDTNPTSSFIDFDRSLVGYWNFENVSGSTVYDSSTYGNNGSFIGGIQVVDLNMIRGKSGFFDGVNSQIVINNVNFNLSSGGRNSVSFWMNWNGVSGVMPIGFGSGNLDLYFSGSSCFGFNTASSDVFGISSVGLENSWHHIIATFYNGIPNNISNEIWIDGVKQSIFQCLGTSGNKSITSNFWISGWLSGPVYMFNGSIDEVMMFNRALDISEIKALYNSQLNPLEYNFTNLSQNGHSYYGCAIDIVGNQNCTETRNLTIDSIIPTIDFVSLTPLNNSFTYNNWIYVNVSINESNLANVTLEFNGVNSSMSCSGIAPNYVCFKNMTGLADGVYNFTAFVNDSIGNFNSTGLRSVLLDQYNPNISFVFPTDANGSFIDRSWSFINVSVNDTNSVSAFIDFNRSLVGYWNFENVSGNTVYDQSSYGNDGIIYHNAKITNENSIRGYYSSFNASNQVVTLTSTYTPELKPTKQLTYAFWAKFSTSTGGIDSKFILQNSQNLKIVRSESTHFIKFLTKIDSNPNQFLTSTIPINNGAWHHIAASLNGTHKSIYIDSVLAGSILETGSQNYTDNSWANNTFMIAPDWFPTGWFNGSLDEVMVFNRGLSAQEVKALYDAKANQLQNNFSNLADGDYIYSACAVDRVGRQNCTETRNLSVDGVFPVINYTLPTALNNSYTAFNWSYINISVNESNLANATLNFNGTNLSMSCVGISPDYNCFYNKTGLISGNYSFNVTVNDSVGHISTLETHNFVVDIINPNINFTIPTPFNNSFIDTNWVSINVSVNDTNPTSAFIDFNRSLVGYWNFENVSGTTVYDQSSYGNNGIIRHNAKITNENSVRGHYSTFNASNQAVTLTSTYTPELQPTKQLTYAFWVKFSASTGGIDRKFILQNSQNLIIKRLESSHLIEFDTQIGSNLQTLTSTIPVSNNVWHHIVTSLNGTHESIYIDSVLAGSIPETGSQNYSGFHWANYTFMIAPDWFPTGWFNGSLDEVMVFNRGLSAQEVKALYDAKANQLQNNFSNLADGDYIYSACAVDRVGRQNCTETRNLSVDGVFPIINYTNPTAPNNSYTAFNWSYINISVNESNLANATLNFNGTNLSMTCVGVSPNYSCFYNKTGLMSGNYSFNVSVNDSVGHVSTLETRNFLVDIINPDINFTIPTPFNNSFIDTNWVSINVSVNDTNSISAFIDFNRSLVGYWNFENVSGSTVYDSSSYGNNAFKANSNSKILNLNSIRGNYLNYKFRVPNDRLSISEINHPELKPSKFTYSFWVKFTPKPGATVQYLVSNGANFFIWRGEVNHKIVFETKINSIQQILTSTISINNNVWHNVVTSHNGSYKSIYIDGAFAGGISQVGSANYTSTHWANNTLMLAPDWFSQNEFNGSIDEFMVFNRGLSAQEVKALYDAKANKLQNNFTNLADGNYRYSACAIDIVGRQNCTGTRNLSVDGVFPIINYTNPTAPNNSYTAFNWSYINISVNESNLANATLNFNGTNLSMTCVGVSPNYSCFYNKTGLMSGNYSFNVSVNDSVGHISTLETRNFVVDIINPNINFTIPTPFNNSFIDTNWVSINVSVNDTNPTSAFIDFNRSLVGYWNFENVSGSTIYDSSSYGNNATLGSGGRILNINGIRGNYLDRSGGNLVAMTISGLTGTELQPVKQISYSFWMRLNIPFTKPGHNDAWIFDNGGLFKSSMYWSSWDNLSYFQNNPSGNTNFPSTISINDTNWHHVVAEYNGTHKVMYIDGIFAGSLAQTGDITYSTGVLNIASPQVQYFNGSIDEFMVFNRGLSGSEAAALYNSQINQLQNNFTNLADGNYRYSACAIDIVGRQNCTGTRNLSVDGVFPIINYTNPTAPNNSYTAFNWSYINISVNESNLANATLNFNGTNLSMTCVGVSPNYSCFYNKTNLADGNYSFNVSVNDSVGHISTLETRNLSLDANPPTFVFVPPTDANNSFVNRSWTFVNVSVNDFSVTSSYIDFNNSLSLYWNFENVSGSVVPDISSHNFNGNMLGGAFINNSGGVRGKYITFLNQPDEVKLSGVYGTVVEPKQKLSYSLWMKMNNRSNSQWLFSNGALGGGNAISWDFATKKIIFSLNPYFNPVSAVSTTQVLPNSWYHIAATYDGVYQKLYINGALESTIWNPLNSIYYSWNSLELAVPGFGWFNGSLDEFMVFNRVISDSEVKALYNSQVNPLESNFTNLNVSTYNYSACGIDIFGHFNCSETRILTVSSIPVINVSSSIPNISFVNPTHLNNSFSKSSMIINVSVSDNDTTSGFIDFNNSLVGYWNFENNSRTVYDRSSYGFNGTMQGLSYVNSSGGIRGKYGVFSNRTDSMRVLGLSGTTALQPTNQISYSFWMRVSSNSHPGWILQNGVFGGGNGFGWSNTTYLVQFTHNPSGVTPFSTTQVLPNSWYHIVGTYDGNSQKLYVNGILESSQPHSGLITYFSPNLYLSAPDSSYWTGSIDEVMVFNRAISASEIKALYDSKANQLQNNFSNLSDGDYIYSACAIDIVGRQNCTETRNLSVDTINPNINFTIPTPFNNSIFGATLPIIVNVSVNDTNPTSAFIDFDRSLVGYWNFENANNTFVNDSSTNNFYGNLLNGVYVDNTNMIRGKYGVFDGINDEIRLNSFPKELNLNTTNKVTISAWVNPTSYGVLHPHIFRYGGGWAEVISLRLLSSTGQLFSEIGNHNGGTAGGASSISSIPLDTWSFVSMSYNGDTGLFKFYIDGILDSNSTGTTLLNFVKNSGTIISIGNFAGHVLNGDWNGSLDEVMVFNRTLSEVEIKALYNSKANALVGNFNNLSGGGHSYYACAIDVAGNQNCTETRDLQIDLIAPLINFTNPTDTNNSFVNRSWSFVNVSMVDVSKLSSVIYNFNGSNLSILDKDLLLYLNFDNVSAIGDAPGKFVDLSGNNYDATCTNCPNYVPGKFGNALKFNGAGNDIFLNSNRSRLFAGNNLTYTAWFKWDGSSAAPWINLLSNGDWHNGFELGSGFNGKFSFRINTTTNFYQFNSNTLINDSKWHQAVGTYNGSIMSLYIDGKLDNTLSANGSLGYIDGYSSIGQNNFNGSIDTVSIYNRSLSEDEVRLLYLVDLKRINSTNWNLEVNNTKLKNGNYTFYACASDDFLNENCTNNRIVNINKSLPLFNITSPLNLSVHNYTDKIYFNTTLSFNLSDLDSLWFELNNNGTKYFLNNIGLLNWSLNLSLNVGKYNVTFYGNDTALNIFNSQTNYFYVTSGKDIQVRKNILNIGKNSYKVEFNITNYGAWRDYTLVDLIPNNFTFYNLSLNYNGSTSIYGNYSGNLTNWNLSLTPLSSKIISYNLNGSYNYNLLNNMMFSID